MTESPFRRVALTLLVYLGAAWLVSGLSGWLRRVLALPELFDTLVAGGLVVGVVVAATVAWHYPAIVAGQEARARAFPPPPER